MMRLIALLAIILTGLTGKRRRIRIRKKILEKDMRINKFQSYAYILDQWLRFKEKKIGLELFFHSYNYRTIAIYGTGKLGRHLYHELMSAGIRVLYTIDQFPNASMDGLESISIEYPLPEADAIIVTPVFDYPAIEKQLYTVTDCPIISLEEVIKFTSLL